MTILKLNPALVLSSLVTVFGAVIVAQQDPVQSKSLRQEIEEIESGVFQAEKAARRVENLGLVPIWDQLNRAASGARLKIIAAIPIISLQLGSKSSQEKFDLGISQETYGPGGPTLNRKQFQDWVVSFQEAGFQIVHTDWHQESFGVEGQLPISEIRFNIQAINSEKAGGQVPRKWLSRIEVKGRLKVQWQLFNDRYAPQTAEVLEAVVARRDGPPAFETKGTIRGIQESSGRGEMGGFSVFDLNGDSFPEIILANANKVFLNNGNWQIQPRNLYPPSSEVISSAIGIVADVTGDGHLDWICSTPDSKLAIISGNPDGTFSERSKTIDLGEFHLRTPSSLTAGDIDHDGDLDLFVTQWRSLYEKMPAKFWDANDGFGNSLLLNDGQGNFTDVTESNGIGKKRFRRSYSSSFFDIDDDSDLDLVVVSDFRGIDVFANDGNGIFTDVTEQVVDSPHAFGMSHTVADYNNDGLLDLFMLGMGSTTARRLDRMEAFVDDPLSNQMRTTMGYGNRMLLRRDGTEPGFKQPAFMDQVARTGWSWGATSFDFDNDGDQDIYVGNGHISGTTTRDYCTNFWCRDINVLPDFERTEIIDYFKQLPMMNEQSWDGFQVNSLLVNQQGEGFKDFSFLLDLGFDYDTRRIVAADLDLDGRVDLLVERQADTSGVFHQSQDSQASATLTIYQNVLPEAKERNWIGVCLTGIKNVSTNGAVVELVTNRGIRRGAVVSGDSYGCQHPAQQHFGLPAGIVVSRLVVRWPGGSISNLDDPKPNMYHQISPTK